MEDDVRLAPRQIWAQPTTSTTKTYQPGCTPFILPSEGYIYLNRTYSISISENAVFEPVCTSTVTDSRDPSPMLDTRDPFYASVTPQLYAIGCATVVSYLLVIILLITPRTFYVGGPGGGANFLGRHGMISGSYSGNSSVVGVGGRPWLQKVAALLVAISLTIATADSFKVAEDQYVHGYSDADALASAVIDGMEIRVIRVISSTFLWLAQVQTLIRLFPRHKEKVMIKWAGFALIVLDTIFSILDKFLVQTNTTRPRLYEDAIPALSYLFELALNLLYAAWVIFYSLSKHRFAFFHPKMRNICLVALLSLCAVLLPVVFFVLDIAKPEVAGWGTYIRWVGSAAASVVVWEWVERIEALERDERKDGILGREIFDGDEMLEVTPSEEVDWPRQNIGNDKGGTGTSSGWGGMMGLTQRPLRTRVGHPGGRNRQPRADAQNPAISNDPRRRGTARPTPPPAAVTPVSRADTTSAASTVYNVHYHPVSSPTPPVAMPHMEEENEADDYDDVAAKELETAIAEHQGDSVHAHISPEQTREYSPQIINVGDRWRTILNPFRRRRASLPREVASAQAEEEQDPIREGDELYLGETAEQESSQPVTNRLFAFSRKSKPASGRQGSDTPLPVTVIPARRRGQHTWAPEWFTDSSLLEPSSSQRARSNRNGLPVKVIQPQARSAAPWATPNEGEFGYGNYELRYDPEAAALVGPDESHSYPQSANNVDHDTNVDLERSSVSERDYQELNQPSPELLLLPQHRQSTNSSSNSSTTISQDSRPPRQGH
ncbi:PalH/RIM21-domain-containing protein [Aspergillus coremiiformis]|uniref:PalH/RIM21-domain-containing protein n=1 Tax=Aspergillus coremiiformis TaxID=138285 RepID=A0A5N6YXT7_9EURO|nr:PalH/RIM21-domain-containing protein [Aspergillus coremiiformis]